MTTTPVPTLYEWLGGIDALNRLAARFYERVAQDALLAPVFAHMGVDHPAHVAAFLAEEAGLGRGQGAVHRRLTVVSYSRWVATLGWKADFIRSRSSGGNRWGLCENPGPQNEATA